MNTGGARDFKENALADIDSVCKAVAVPSQAGAANKILVSLISYSVPI